jgi:hypothetical protein
MTRNKPPRPEFSEAVCLAYDSHLSDVFEQLVNWADYYPTPEALKASEDWQNVARLAGRATYDFDPELWTAAGWTERQAVALLNKATREAQGEVIEAAFSALLAERRAAEAERRTLGRFASRTPAIRQRGRI